MIQNLLKSFQLWAVHYLRNQKYFLYNFKLLRNLMPKKLVTEAPIQISAKIIAFLIQTLSKALLSFMVLTRSEIQLSKSKLVAPPIEL